MFLQIKALKLVCSSRCSEPQHASIEQVLGRGYPGEASSGVHLETPRMRCRSSSPGSRPVSQVVGSFGGRRQVSRDNPSTRRPMSSVGRSAPRYAGGTVFCPHPSLEDAFRKICFPPWMAAAGASSGRAWLICYAESPRAGFEHSPPSEAPALAPTPPACSVSGSPLRNFGRGLPPLEDIGCRWGRVQWSQACLVRSPAASPLDRASLGETRSALARAGRAGGKWVGTTGGGTSGSARFGAGGLSLSNPS